MKTKETLLHLQEVQTSEAIGNEIARVLLLEKNENGRYDTVFGERYPLGLGRTVRHIVVNIEEKYREFNV